MVHILADNSYKLLRTKIKFHSSAEGIDSSYTLLKTNTSLGTVLITYTELLQYVLLGSNSFTNLRYTVWIQFYLLLSKHIVPIQSLTDSSYSCFSQGSSGRTVLESCTYLIQCCHMTHENIFIII